jgi:hypothetical protein
VVYLQEQEDCHDFINTILDETLLLTQWVVGRPGVTLTGLLDLPEFKADYTMPTVHLDLVTLMSLDLCPHFFLFPLVFQVSYPQCRFSRYCRPIFSNTNIGGPDSARLQHHSERVQDPCFIMETSKN